VLRGDDYSGTAGRIRSTCSYNWQMGWVEWAFSGLGASLVIFVLGFFGTKAVQRRRSVRQIQKAGDNATQIQSGRDTKVDS
jgi:hypothetical protein